VATLGLTAVKREAVGKGAARKLRGEGMVPAVAYGGGATVHLAVRQRDLVSVLGRGRSETSILTLQVEGEAKQRQVILKDVQYDPVRGDPLHADLYEVSMDRVLKVSVPIRLVGEAPGVKRDGGLLHQLLRDLEVECLPSLIPGEVTVDLSSLLIGDVIHVRELKLGEGVRVLTHAEEPIVSVTRPEVEKVPVPEEAAAPAAAPAEGVEAAQPQTTEEA